MKNFELIKTYDLEILARANLHTHSVFSGCAKREMDILSMVRRADELGLETIAVTDHFHSDTGDERLLEYIKSIKTAVSESGCRVKVLYGAELSAIGPGARLEAPETNAALDYRLYSTNHFHCPYWTQPEEKTARGYALYMLDIVSELANSGYADCIAHPFVGNYIHAVEDRHSVSAAITDNELGEILSVLRDTGVAYEINYRAALNFPEFSRRWWGIGKEVGVIFTIGTDAHTLADIDTVGPLPEIKKALGEI